MYKSQLKVSLSWYSSFTNYKDCVAFKFAFETTKMAVAWLKFLEGVELKLETPHIVYKHCKSYMPHPNRNAYKSPTNMVKYLKGGFKY